MRVPDRDWLYEAFLAAIPGEAPKSVVSWAEQSVRIVGSAKSDTFDRTTGPWLNEPIECARFPGRYVLVLPIQSGKSTAGEIIICYWVTIWNSGDIGYYWPNTEKALSRWDRYTQKRLEACGPVMKRASNNRHDWNRGFIAFPHLNFSQLGAKTDSNVSDHTLRGVMCEELHDIQGGWEPGQLEKVFGRQTAVWDSVAFLISVASQKGDQFHQAFEAGTQEHWEVKCPACSNPHHPANAVYHVMRTRWDDEQPQVGGLRYDANGCRRPDGTYDYNRLASTIFIQLPCGHRVHDNPMERRQLSLSGRYSEPRNKGARPNNRSFHMEAISNHDTDLIKLIEQKHRAIRAMKSGDPELFEVYTREQESRFWSLEDRPTSQSAIVLSSRNKDREGLTNRAARFGMLDYQEGEGDELPHWWLLIQDWSEQGDSLIVCEGKCVTDTEVIDTLNRHSVQPIFVVADSGWNADHVYAFCLKHGFNCLKVDGKSSFPHEDGSRHTWSEEVPLHVLLGLEPSQEDPDKEPYFWHCAKWGAMERLGYVRGCRKYEVPADVSQDFLDHMAAWSRDKRKHPRTGEEIVEWKQTKKHDHLYQCAVYGCQVAEMYGLVGLGSLPPPADTTAEEKVNDDENVSNAV